MNVDVPSAPPPTTILQSGDTVKVLNHHQYSAPDSLTPSTVLPSPLDQFRAWFTASQPYVAEPEAMTLATTNAKGIPSARVVLLKQADAKGFVFFTNYGARKSREIEETGYAALAFYWREVHKQVRVVGRVERVSKEESEAYFRSRPIGSRVGAWASRQSEVVQEGELDARVEKVKEQFGVKEGETEGEVPLPEFWGGWRIVPQCVLSLFAVW